MPRRRKRLVDVVRDATFLARKDEQLLQKSEPLPWPKLERLRKQFRAAGNKDERRAIALQLEHGLREYEPDHYFGRLQDELAKLGPRGSYEQLERFAAKFFRHYAGPAAGKPFKFSPFQRDELREFYRRDKQGRRIYTVGVSGQPKGQGKTPRGAVMGTHALVTNVDSPEVYNVAGSRDQAGHCYEFAHDNIQDGALAAWLELGSVIRCPEHRGEYEVLSSDGDLAAGIKPTAYIVDEWWLFMHRKQREAYNSGAKALHKRPGEAFLYAMSTAGFDKSSQLGETYDAAMADPRTERLNDGFLHVLRDEEAGFLFWWYGVPDDLEVDIEDPKVIRACNPAPWVSPRDLLRELHRHDTDELDWRRLHLNQWTKTQNAWLPTGAWRALTGPEIPRGADIYVAVDAGLKYDTSAVAWAARLENGRIAVRAKVWSARNDAPAHVFVPGGRIRNSLVQDFIADELADRYRVREVVYDPRYFDTQGENLADRGLTVAEFPQASAAMADAYQHWYEAVTDGEVCHDGDRIFAAHVDAAAAVMTERGWKVFKLKSWQPIDALVAAAMARERCAREGGSEGDWLLDTRVRCECSHLERDHVAGVCMIDGCLCTDCSEAS